MITKAAGKITVGANRGAAGGDCLEMQWGRGAREQRKHIGKETFVTDKRPP